MNDDHVTTGAIPFQRQTPDFASGAKSGQSLSDSPARPDELVVSPDELAPTPPVDEVKLSPESSGSITTPPDGWITVKHSFELLKLAGFKSKDDRSVRELCRRNELKSVRVRNEMNQWQHFIDPASVGDYIAKNPDLNSSGLSGSISPDHPDEKRNDPPEKIEKPDPASSGQKAADPDGAGNHELTLEVAVLTERLKGKDELIEELRDDKKHLRTQLDSANQLRDHVMKLAGGTEAISKDMLQTLRAIATRIDAPAKEPQPSTPIPATPAEYEVKD